MGIVGADDGVCYCQQVIVMVLLVGISANCWNGYHHSYGGVMSRGGIGIGAQM